MNPWERLERLGAAVRAPAATAAERQWRWLKRCLHRNASTRYGKRHGFSDVRSAADYQRRVPLATYDDLRRDIRRIHRGESDVLFRGKAAAFEWTGGSAAGKKLIPYSRNSFDDFRRSALPWLGRLIRTHRLRRGTVYWALSPVHREGGNERVGVSEEDYLGPAAARCLRALSAVSVDAAADPGKWERETLSQLIHRSDLAFVSLWSPTFLLSLLEALDRHAAALVRMFPGHAGLRRYLRTRRTSALWPRLKVISCWTEGSSHRYCRTIKTRFPHAVIQPKGLALTEGVVTFPDERDRLRLALDSGFFEFLDGRGVPRLAGELSRGGRYEVVLTTSGGLYRYRTGDRVRCQGHVAGEPILSFEGRGGLCGDLAGEKLTEDFVSRCLQPLRGFAMLTQNPSPAPGYDLVIDAKFATRLGRAAIESRLRRNPHYRYARRLNQLRPLSVVPLSDPEDLYRRHAGRRGQSPGNIKFPALCLDPGWWKAEAPCP